MSSNGLRHFMRTRLTWKFVFSLTICFAPAFLFAQWTITNGAGSPGGFPEAENVNVCTADPNATLTFTLIRTGPAAMIAPTVDVALATGVLYVPGSVRIVSSSGFTMPPTLSANMGTDNAPSFTITPPLLTYPQGARITIEISRVGACASISQLGVVDMVSIDGVNANSDTYDVRSAVLTVIGDAPVTTTVGSTEMVTGTITNGGNGSIDSFLLKVNEPSGISTQSISINGIPLTIINTMGTMDFYLIDSAVLVDANVGDGDGILQGGESFVFDREVMIISCDITPNPYRVLYGCNDEICETSAPANQQWNIDFLVPRVRYMGGEVVQATNLCDTIIVEHTFTNVGFGAALDLSYFAGFGASGLTLAGTTSGTRKAPVVGVCINGVAVPFTVSGATAGLEVDLSTAMITMDPDGAMGLADLDMDNNFDDLPAGASVTFTLKHEVLPEPNCPATRSTGGYKAAVDYTDGCGDPLPRVISAAAGSLIDFTQDGPGTLFGPSDINDGDCISLMICGSQRFGGTMINCPTDIMTLVGDLPPGFTMTSATVDGADELSEMQSNDSIFVAVDFVSTQKICFNVELKFDCAAFQASGSSDLGFDFKFVYLCDENADCDATEVFSCPVYAPIIHCGDCTTGGLTTRTTLATRSTLGFANPLTCEDRADPATLDPLQLKFAMTCDTVCIEALGLQVGGTSGPTWDNAHFHFEYDPVAAGGARTLNYSGGTVDVYDAANMTTSTWPMPAPTDIDINNAGGGNDLHIMEFDLTSCLVGLPNMELRAGDSVNVNLKVVVSSAGALDDDVPIQLEDVAMYHYNLVDTTTPPDMILDTVTCDRYGLELYLHEARNGGGGGLTNRQVRGCNSYSGFKTFPFSGSEDWYPGEIRPNYKLDSVFIEFTSQDELDFSSVVLRAEGNTADGYGALTYIPLALGMPDRMVENAMLKRYVWVNDGTWPLGDMNGRFNSQGGYSFLANFTPSCESVDGRLQMGFYAQRNGYADPACYEAGNNIGNVAVDHTLPTANLMDQTGVVEATRDTVCWTVQLGNIPNVSGGFFFLGLEDLAAQSLDVIELRDVAADTLIPLTPYSDGDWAVVNSNFPPQSALEYKITAVLDACNLDSVKVLSGFECAAPPVDPTVSCSYDSLYLMADPLQTRVQLLLSQQRAPYEICMMIQDTIEVTSAERAFLYDPLICIPIPPGLNEDNLQVEIEYPKNSGVIQMVPFDINATADTGYIDLELHPTIMALGGIPGTDDALNQFERQADVRLVWVTDCDFRAGSSYTPIIRGNRPCGDPAIGDGNRTISDPLTILGAMPSYDAAIQIDLGADTLRGCAPTTFDFEIFVATGATTDADSAILSLPIGTSLVPGSFVCPLPMGDPACPTLISTMMQSGREVLTIKIPANQPANTNIPFELQVAPNPDGLCNEDGQIDIVLTSTITGIFCETIGTDCDAIQVQIAEGMDSIHFLKTDVMLTSVTAACVGVNNFSYEGFVAIADVDLGAGEELEVRVACSTDPVTFIDSVTVVGPLTTGDSLPFAGSFASTCAPPSLIFSIGNDENCVCDPISLEVPAVKLTHTKELVGMPELQPDGNYKVTHLITVTNLGAIDGVYTLDDQLSYDPDVRVDSINFTPMGGMSMSVVLGAPANETSFNLATDSILPPGASFTYTVCVFAGIEIGSNMGSTNPTVGVYDPCSGEDPDGSDQTAFNGLFNETLFDFVDDGMEDERDTACADLPQITHTKTVLGMPVLQPDGNYKVTYQIVVDNSDMLPVQYNLFDTLRFDGDVAVDSLNFTDPSGTVNPVPLGTNPNETGMMLATDSIIDGGTQDIYLICVYARIDLNNADNNPATVDGSYDPCATGTGTGEMPYQGLYNESSLDGNDNGMIDERDTACVDLPEPDIDIIKEIASGPASTGIPDELEITYRIIVSNSGAGKGTYDLSDTLRWGDGTVITDIDASYENGDGLMGTDNFAAFNGQAFLADNDQTVFLLDDDEMLLPGRADSFLIAVTFELNQLLTSTSSNCDFTGGEDGSGLYNVAVINDNVPLDSSEVCAEIPIPPVGLSKTISQGPDATGAPNQFCITYQIRAFNLEDVAATYSLYDTLSYGIGVAVDSVQASYVGGDGINPSANNNLANFDGINDLVLVEDETVSGILSSMPSEDTFAVKVFFTIDPLTLTPEEADCDLTTGSTNTTGLLNRAILIDLEGPDTSRVCAPIPFPELTLEKQILNGPMLTGMGGIYQIDYLVIVSNIGTGKATYELSDTLRYGAGTTITDVSASYLAGDGLMGMDNFMAFDGTSDHLLIDDEMVDVGRSDSVVISVMYTLDFDEITMESADCDLSTGSNTNSGLLNIAVLSDVPIVRDTACAELPMISHEKTLAGDPELQPEGNYKVTYVITVDNSGTTDTEYSLSDQLSYDPDVRVDSIVFTPMGGSAVSAPLGTPANETEFQLASDSLLAAGTMFTYTICVYVEIEEGINTGSTNPTPGEYDPCTGTDDPGSDQTAFNGLFNESALDIDGDGMPEQVDTACADLPTFSHEKSLAGDPVLQPDGNYKVTYEVSVTNTGAVDGLYSLDDQLSYDPDVRVDSIVFTPMGGMAISVPLGTPANETAFNLATDSLLATGQSFIYTVCVFAYVEIDANTGSTNPTAGVYDPCTSSTDPGSNQTAFNGLFNLSSLDVNGDGMPEEVDTACADLPNLEHAKTTVGKPVVGPDGNYKVTYEVTVSNTGGLAGLYSLADTIRFDGDVRVDSISYILPDGSVVAVPLGSPPNETGFELASEELLAAGETDTFTVCVYVDLDVTNPGGNSNADGAYDPCTGPTNASDGQTAYSGLFNESSLDEGSDGTTEDVDTACADLEIYDLALIKTIDPAYTGPYSYFDTIKYITTVINQGTLISDSTIVTDYLPTGLTFLPDLNPGWDDSGANPSYLITNQLIPGQDTMICMFAQIVPSSDADAWLNVAEISYSQDTSGMDQSENDRDSELNDDPDDNGGSLPNTEADDYVDGDGSSMMPDGVDSTDQDNVDPALIDIIDLALIKQIDAANTIMPLSFGGLVKFFIIVQNQGNVVMDSVRVQDYPNPGFDFDPTLPENVALGWQPDGSLIIEGPLGFAEFDTTCIYLTLQSVANPTDTTWLNYGEITEAYDTSGMEVAGNDADSEPGSDSEEERDIMPGDEGDDDLESTDRDSTGSEDDHDVAGTLFLDLALTKVLDSTAVTFPLAYGDTIKFKISVINQEGVMVDSVRVQDYLPEGLSFDATWPQNAALGWQSDASIILPGPIMVGDTAETCIYAVINTVAAPTSTSWVNYAEIIEAYMGDNEIAGMDIDSDPGSNTPEEMATYPGEEGDNDVLSNSNDSIGSQDDHDPALVEIFDLALRKSSVETTAYPGLLAKFIIEVVNQGGVAATNIEVTDYIAPGFDFDETIPENMGWSAEMGGLTTFIITDTLYPGDIDTVCIFLTVNNNIAPADLINVAEISMAEDTSGVDRDDIDGSFDDTPGDDAGGMVNTDSDDTLDGDGTGNPGDTDADTDEDNSDPATLLPCVPLNCVAKINIHLGRECEREITAADVIAGVGALIAQAVPEFYEIEVTVDGIVIRDNILRRQHVGRNIAVTVTWIGPASCPGGTCWTAIELQGEKEPIIEGTTSKTVYCFDPLISEDPNAADYTGNVPTAFQTCSDRVLTPRFVADWTIPYDCELGVQDTAKVIYREWEAFSLDEKRVSAFDTIVVLRTPPIQDFNTICVDRDTLYCGVGGKLGPYMLVPDVCPEDGETECDTICFLNPDGTPNTFDTKCGILIHSEVHTFDAGSCETLSKYTVEIKQACYGQLTTDCVLPGAPGSLEIEGQIGEPLYVTCEFWVVDLDTLPPRMACKYDDYEAKSVIQPEGQASEGHCFDTPERPGSNVDAPIVIVPTGSHECAAHTYLPPVCVYEDWTGVKTVKASIEGIGTWVLEPGDSCMIDSLYNGNCYAYHTPVKLPKSDYPYQIKYEAFDSCHNVGTVYCYVVVKDRTKPVVVVDKGVTVSLSGKKVWVEAESFDEGSWDNCGEPVILARRADWYEACVDLCMNVKDGDCGQHAPDLVSGIEACYISEHHDTLWQSVLETKKECDEVEAHYAKLLEWWCNDGLACGELLYDAWLYDLIKHGTKTCVDHQYEVDDHYIHELISEALKNDPAFAAKFKVQESHLPGCETDAMGGGQISDTYLDQLRQLGGGWSDEVVFDCEDACSMVTVEVLAIDYWCNWSKAWMDVWVEDKTPVEVVKDVVDGEITCKSYRTAHYDYPGEAHPVSLEAIIDQAKAGEADAYTSLDAIFGGYCKAWEDDHGNYVDSSWQEIDCDITFSDSMCYVHDTILRVRKYDEHYGYIWQDSLVGELRYKAENVPFQKGIVKVNCADNVQCAQEVWCDFDHCGQGYIYRKFKMWQGCPSGSAAHSPHEVDTIERIQRIWVGNECELSKYMFEVPEDVTVHACGIEYDPDGSGQVVGDAGPEQTGYATYTEDDDCRIVGIAHEDKVFDVVGGDEGCVKIIRTWYFADWCGGKPDNDYWYRDNELIQFSCEQKILVIDTFPPSCMIRADLAAESGVGSEADPSVFAIDGGCIINFGATVAVQDACGIIELSWELKDLKTSNVVANDAGSLEGDSLDVFAISIDNLSTGTYKLVSLVRDACQNEAYCEYYLNVDAGKKPGPVCVTSLTAELQPWDIDQDGTIDTAASVVWAREFESSSIPPCGEDYDSLQFYIEWVDQASDVFERDRVADSLAIGCDRFGTQMARLWVVSESGSADYCDVLMNVQDNTGSCSDGSRRAYVSGNVVNQLDESIIGAEVELIHNSGLMDQILSSLTGAYFLEGRPNQTLDVTVKKDGDDARGVSTADLIKIQKHLLGKKEISSKHLLKAADANNDGRVSPLDLVLLRRLVLGIDKEFQYSDSWRFYSSENDEEVYRIDALKEDMVIDWVGVKIGDVNLDYSASSAARTADKTYRLEVSEQELEAGLRYRISFANAVNIVDLAGYQSTLQFDSEMVELLEIDAKGELPIGSEHFGDMQLSDGLVSVSWNHLEGSVMPLDRGAVMFSVIFEAKQDGHLSDVLSVGNAITRSEAYRSNGETMDVALTFSEEGALAQGFELHQNRPNPFRGQTRVSFTLPESQRATLTIYDGTGRMLKNFEQVFDKGYNSLEVQLDQLANQSILYYQLDTKDFTATRKMTMVN